MWMETKVDWERSEKKMSRYNQEYLNRKQYMILIVLMGKLVGKDYEEMDQG